MTVTGVDNNDVDGSVAYVVQLQPARSTDTTYAGVDGQDVMGTTTDDDRAGIVISPVSGLVVSEAGASAKFNVRLTSRPSDPAGVSMAFATSDRSEGFPTTSTIRFNQSNWQRGIDVPVRGVDDFVADGDQRFTVRVSLIRSFDSNYARIAPASLPAVNFVNTDNEIPKVELITRSPLVTTEKGGNVTIFVRLMVRPTTNVRVNLTTSDRTEGVLSTYVADFTPQNFYTAQRIVVTGVDDSDDDGNKQFTVNATATATRGTPYDGLKAEPLTFTNIDDEDKTAPTITVTNIRPDGVYLLNTIREIVGTATDAAGDSGSGVASVKASLQRVQSNGQTTFLRPDATFGITPSEGVTSRVGSDGNFRLGLRSPLEAGTYTLKVTGTDLNGNTSEARTITFVVTATPVSITIRTPADGASLTTAPAVSGSFNSVSGPADVVGLRIIVRLGSRIVRNFSGDNLTVVRDTFTTPVIGNLPDGVYTIEASAADRLGNTVRVTSTFTIDTTAPASVVITSPTNNGVVDTITQITGTVSDNTNGAGIDRVELVIVRNTDGKYFNGTTFVTGAATVAATVSGSNFSYRVNGTFPADPDPLNATYTIQAVAYDKAGNRATGTPILVYLSTNRSRPGVSAASSAQVSSVKLSTLAASAAASSVTLNFTGNLSAASATDVANYEVTVGGQSVELEGASLHNGSVVLSLPEGSVKSAAAITVTYKLLDTQKRVVRGQANTSAR